METSRGRVAWRRDEETPQLLIGQEATLSLGEREISVCAGALLAWPRGVVPFVLGCALGAPRAPGRLIPGRSYVSSQTAGRD